MRHFDDFKAFFEIFKGFLMGLDARVSLLLVVRDLRPEILQVKGVLLDYLANFFMALGNVLRRHEQLLDFDLHLHCSEGELLDLISFFVA